MSQTVKDKIIERTGRLADPQQRQVLDFARKLALPAGVPGQDLLRFVGAIAPSDLDAISQAVLEGRERCVDCCRRTAIRSSSGHS